MEDLIKEYLPTNTSRVLTALIFTAVPSSLFLYDFLKRIGVEVKYLAKTEVRLVIALTVLSFFLLIITVNLIKFITKTQHNKQHDNQDSNSEPITPNTPELSILTQVIKLRSLNQAGNPVSIAKQIDSEPEIVLAHLNKLHNEHQVTYITGGKPPTVDTGFFLCPKALERISFQANIKKQRRNE